jgi:IclR family mhp operon transcriptional activator
MTHEVNFLASDDRLLKVLRALNQIAPCTVQDLHRLTGISRQAIYRVVESLSEHGYVQRIPGTSRVRLTSEVRALSAGYRDGDRIVEVGTPVIERLQRELRWPTSLATADRDRMVVRETTRYRSPFVFDRGAVGMRLPMLKTALGLAYLSFCSRPTRQIVLDLLRRSNNQCDALARDTEAADRLLRNTLQRAYAFRAGGVVAETSSIALPIRTDGEPIGSICVTFATSALSQRQAAAAFLPALRAAAEDIGTQTGRS